jgi:hypothetical protein
MEVVNTTSTTEPVYMYNKLNGIIMRPIVFIIVLIILLSYYVFSSSLGNNQGMSGENYSFSGKIMGGIIVLILIILILINAAQYFFSVNVIAYLKGILTPSPKIDIVVDQSAYQPSPVPEIKLRPQVFNIPGNNYTYEQAKSICTAYDAKLASYDELEEAYGKGAEWCNYGWSEGQMALFPTQKKTYSTLKAIKGHEHDCGRPGINGGYMANPNVRYGINCYGHKPKRTEIEKELMENTNPYPLTKEDMLMEKQVDYWKEQLPNIIVSPFNNNRWSKF